MAYTGYRLNILNIEEHQLVTESHPNLVLKPLNMKGMYSVDILNINAVDRGVSKKNT